MPFGRVCFDTAPTLLGRLRSAFLHSSSRSTTSTMSSSSSSSSSSPSSRIQLIPEEERLVSALDAFARELYQVKQQKVELRIAGGWVRDKLLGLPSSDLDVAISTMTGFDFATQFAAWVDCQRPSAGAESKPTHVACIAANPEQSKHLETATATLFDRDIDFVQLRSEEYGQGSRIPTGVKFGSPLDDALRRDITINALFFNCHSRQVEDFTEKGLPDLLSQPLIRCPLHPFQTFFDDPLRILRCIRFATRFGFPLDQEVVQTVSRDDIKEALRTKVSRERVWIELGKMLKDPFALHALRLICQLGLFPLLLCTPPETWPLSAPLPQHLDQLGLSAVERLAAHAPQPVSPTQRHTLDYEQIPQASCRLPDAFRQDVGLDNPDIRKRLYLAAALTPLRDITTTDKKKEIWLGDKMLRDVLGVANSDRLFITKLHQSATLLRTPQLDRFQHPTERVALGQLLRHPSVHDTVTGPTWQTSIFFAYILELREAVASGDAESQQRITDVYLRFIERLQDLEMPSYAFDKPKIDGNEVSQVLGFKPGKATGDLLSRVIDWQLDHPHSSKEDCLAWFKKEHEGGTFAELLAPPTPAPKNTKKPKKA